MNTQKKINLLLGLTLSFFLRTYCLLGQPTPVVIEHIGKEEGLRDFRYNTFIKKDTRGFVWISSEQGLFRYDGNFIKNYPITDTDGRSYGEIIQSDLWEDQLGDFWFTTVFALHKFNRASDELHTWQFNNDSIKIEKDYHAIYLEKETEQLWLSTDRRLWRCDLKTMSPITPLLETNGIRFVVDTAANGTVKNIIACPWWVEKGIEVWQEDAFGNWRAYIPDDPILSDATVCNGEIIDNIAWLATTNKGLLSYDLNEQKVTGQYVPSDLPGLFLWDISLWGKDLILCAKDEGIWYFDTQTERFSKAWSGNDRLSTTNPIAVYIDPEQHAWVTHPSHGIDHIYLQQDLFSNPFEDLSLEGVNVIHLLEEKSGNIWVLTRDHGILVFSREGDLLQHFDPNGIPATLPEQLVYLSIDSTGQVWGNSNESIYRYVEHEKSWRKVYHGEHRLISLFHHISGKHYLITNTGVFNFATDRDTIALSLDPLFRDYQNYEFEYFFFGADNLVYAPYNDFELWLFSPSDRTSAFRGKHVIAAETYDVYHNPSSCRTWIGTEKGLFVYEDDQLELVLDHQRFLQPCSIYAIQQDLHGDLWLGTDKGLWKYNVSENHLLKYSIDDGLSDNLFFRNAKLIDSEGKLWLGTESGLSVFKPEVFRRAFEIPRSYIEQLWINGKLYQGDSVLSEAREIQLSYFDNTLEFELRTIAYEGGKKSSIRYRLLGYDEQWSKVSNGGIARFTKLPPGEYQFEMRPVSSHNIEGGTHKLTIIIPPPFYQTWWFKLLVVLAVILLIVSIVATYYRRKLRAERAALERQETIATERNRIMTELHNHIGADLTAIRYLSEDLLDLGKKEERDAGQEISQFTQNAMDNMQELIWLSDSRKNNLEELKDVLRSYAGNFLKACKMTFDAEMPQEDQSDIYLGAEKRWNIISIFKEGLNNIVKHAAAQKVFFRLYIEDQKLVLHLKDDGQGFDTTDRSQKGGNGLYNMPRKAKIIDGELSITSELGKGTSILLKVPL